MSVVTVHIHLFHCVTTPEYSISVVLQLHSAALDNVFQFTVLAVLPTSVWPVKLLAVGVTLLNVYVAVCIVVFDNESVTHHVFVIVPGVFCDDIVVPVVVPHVVPSKLYADHGNPTHTPSLATVIPRLHATHSFPAPLLNVNVGHVLS